MIILVFAILGLVFGSFVNALVWRIYKQENTPSKKVRAKYSISKGRSMCVHCGHQLSAKDLIPLLSWFMLAGKCRYCKKPISRQYPLVELSTALLFVLSYIFWPGNLLTSQDIIEFAVWIFAITGFVALVVYDIRYMILPNKIIFPLLAIASAALLIESFLDKDIAALRSGVAGLLVGGSLFYILFQISKGAWIGGGDVKLGFLLGLLVGGPSYAFLMLFLASVFGSLFSIPLIITHKLTVKTRIPFGPFLIMACIITKLFGAGFISWYSQKIIGS